MKIGAVHFFTDLGVDPIAFGQAAETLGFESLFVPEHTHFPVQRSSAYPAAYGGGELPSFYLRTLDQTVTLAMIAAHTTTLKLGTGICLLAQHDPISKAKELATLDHLSGGRLIFGVGFGWNVAEAEAHGVIWSQRFSTVRDKVGVIRALWTQDEASFTGQRATLAPSQAWPKPRRTPPVYLGGAGPTTMKHAAEWADTWYVIPPPDDITLERTIPQFRQVLEQAGRDPGSVGIAVASAPADPAVLDRYREQGVERAVLWVQPEDNPSAAMRNLESAATALT